MSGGDLYSMSDNKIQVVEADEGPSRPYEFNSKQFEDDGREEGELEASFEVVSLLDSEPEVEEVVEHKEVKPVEVVTIETDNEEDNTEEIQIVEEHLNMRDMLTRSKLRRNGRKSLTKSNEGESKKTKNPFLILKKPISKKRKTGRNYISLAKWSREQSDERPKTPRTPRLPSRLLSLNGRSQHIRNRISNLLFSNPRSHTPKGFINRAGKPGNNPLLLSNPTVNEPNSNESNDSIMNNLYPILLQRTILQAPLLGQEPSSVKYSNRRLVKARRAAINNYTRRQYNLAQAAPLPPVPVNPQLPPRKLNMVVNPAFRQEFPSTSSCLRDNSNTSDSDALRPIIIDGSNVAMSHGNNRLFSCKGLQICAQFFIDRGHKIVKIVVPQFRRKHKESIDTNILEELAEKDLVTFSPSREYKDENNLIVRIVPYDDRFILQIATQLNGIVVSNDNYKDIHQEGPVFRETIEKRVLQFAWVNDLIFFAQDPLGCRGPTLDQFLRF